MFLRSRLHDRPQRRSLVAIGLVLSAAATLDSSRGAADEWVARQAINQQVPLTDPSPKRTPSREIETAPKSTLRFVVPENNYGKPTPLPSGTQGLHSLYGPGMMTVVEPAVSKRKPTTDRTRAAALLSTSGDQDKQAVDPGQNEPPAILDSHKSVDPLLAETNIAAETQDSVLDAVAPPPQRLEVRNLKLKVDTLNDPPSISQRTKAEPSSRRKDDAHQSISDDAIEVSVDGHQRVGDERPERMIGVDSSDRIGAKGDLVLALGLPSAQQVIPEAAKLRAPIERTLNYYWVRPENAQERTHWGMFHAMMVYDKDTHILDGKKRFNAVAWMAGNNPCRDDLLFEEDQHGLNVKSGIGLQGHQAQLLAVLGLIDVPSNYPIYVGKNKYTIEDVIRREMRACKSGNELTFTLIGLAHYVDTDSQWVTFDGERWNFERLIQEELSQPIVGAACGGTHRLMGFAHALRRRRAEGKPLEGQWARADQYIRDFIGYTWELQNRDGSMSTDWFEKLDDNGKMDRKVQTTGHMIEFLVTAVPDDELQSPRMIRSLSYLVNTLHDERGHEWQIGPKGHALRAIAMYYQRVFGRQDPWRPMSVARVGASGRR